MLLYNSLVQQKKGKHQSNKAGLQFAVNVNVLSKSKHAKRKNKKQVWKPMGKVYTDIGYKWKPTGRTITIVRNKCPLTRFTSTKIVPPKETTIKSVLTPTPGIKIYSRRPKATKFVGYLNCSMFGNDQIAKIMGYGDYQIGNVTISRHRRLSHLNFNTINKLAKQGLVRGLPKLKFEKDHLCFACSLGKSKKHSHKPKFEDTNQDKLYLLHMDLCGPMGVESINGKKYILVIVDDYSWFTWVKFLRSKDEALEFIIKFLKMIQVRLNATVRNIRTNNGTDFVNQILRSYYEYVSISHETSGACTPQKNDIVERLNLTLVEVARTMLVYAKAPLFLWAEAVAIAYYTQNCSLICLCHGKTRYELLHDRKPYLSYLHVFGALCYPTNDNEDLGKLKAKAAVEMAFEQNSLGPTLHESTPGMLYSGLVPNPPSPTPFVPQTRNDWDTLFQPLFDEYFNPSPSVDHPVPKVAALEPTVSTVIPPYVEEADHDIKVAHIDNDPYFAFPIPEPSFEESSSQVVIPNNVHSINHPPEHISKWIKDHPIDNVIDDPSKPVCTRHQLQTEALLCYFDAFLSFVERKSYKEALMKSCWIEAMQEELNEFKHLEV
ncbi:retrovirus-related pol polyprotein from transposon TNT 1-94 [Tanacetum coccineum]